MTLGVGSRYHGYLVNEGLRRRPRNRAFYMFRGPILCRSLIQRKNKLHQHSGHSHFT